MHGGKREEGGATSSGGTDTLSVTVGMAGAVLCLSISLSGVPEEGGNEPKMCTNKV